MSYPEHEKPSSITWFEILERMIEERNTLRADLADAKALREITPTHDELAAMAAASSPPQELAPPAPLEASKMGDDGLDLPTGPGENDIVS